MLTLSLFKFQRLYMSANDKPLLNTQSVSFMLMH